MRTPPAVVAIVPLTIALAMFAACGPRASSADEGAGTVAGIDTSREGLIAFAKSGQYQDWTAEPAAHDSDRAHGSKARVFFNDALADSLRAESSSHPVGSVTVKELFAADGETLTGHAIDVKVADEQGANAWIFFEGFGPDYADPYYGRGHPTCTGCHAAGVDYVRTPLPQ